MSADLSKDALGRLHEAMAYYVESRERPGIVTLVSRHGETHVDAIGTLAFDNTKPMRRDTIFRIASISKPIIAAVTLQMIEVGQLALDEPVDRLIPELANRRVLKRLDGPLDDTLPAKRPILVSDLLTMRMGLGAIMAPGDYPIMAAMQATGVFTPFRMPIARNADAWIARLAELPLMEHPGEAWRYDTSFTLLGALIERAAAKPLGQVLAERLFEPLGMRDTGFAVPADKLDRLPLCYQHNRETGKLEVWDPSGPESFFATVPGFPGAHGGLVSTVDDYFAFARMLLDKGRAGDRQLLSERSVEAMMADQVPDGVKARSPFVPGFWEQRGWGFGGSPIKRKLAGEPRGFGWDGGYGTSAYWDRETGVTVMMFSQRLVDSPVYPQLQHDFFDNSYAAAGV